MSAYTLTLDNYNCKAPYRRQSHLPDSDMAIKSVAMRRNALETSNAHANGAPAVTGGGTLARQGQLAGTAG